MAARYYYPGAIHVTPCGKCNGGLIEVTDRRRDMLTGVERARTRSVKCEECRGVGRMIEGDTYHGAAVDWCACEGVLYLGADNDCHDARCAGDASAHSHCQKCGKVSYIRCECGCLNQGT